MTIGLLHFSVEFVPERKSRTAQHKLAEELVLRHAAFWAFFDRFAYHCVHRVVRLGAQEGTRTPTPRSAST